MAYTTPTARTTGDIITASIWNVDLKDNLRYLKGMDGAVTFEDAIRVSNDANSGVEVTGGEAYWIGDAGDNLRYNRGDNVFLWYIGGTEYQRLSTTIHKFPLTRQGAAGTNWSTAGTTNEAETGAFVQCGSVNIAFGAGAQSANVIVTLPIALAASQSAVAFAISQANASMICAVQVSSQTQITILGQNRDNANLTGDIPVYWFVIGQ